jgi:hypothetical protein
MARRNRKHGYEGNRVVFWGMPILFLAAVLGMVYLHLFNTCERLGRNIKRLEYERAELNKRVVNEERNWGTASSIRNVEKLMEAHGIRMTFPSESQIVRIPLSEIEEPAQYASRGDSTRRD